MSLLTSFTRPSPGPILKRKTGRVFSFNTLFSGTRTTLAMSANLLYFAPIAPMADETVDQVQVAITVAGGAGKLARLGLWTPGSDPLTATLITDIGEIAIDGAAGLRTLSISRSWRRGLLLYASIVSNDPVTIRGFAATQDVIGMSDADDATIRGISAVSFTYGALPSTITMTSVSNTAPGIAFRTA